MCSTLSRRGSRANITSNVFCALVWRSCVNVSSDCFLLHIDMFWFIQWSPQKLWTNINKQDQYNKYCISESLVFLFMLGWMTLLVLCWCMWNDVYPTLKFNDDLSLSKYIIHQSVASYIIVWYTLSKMPKKQWDLDGWINGWMCLLNSETWMDGWGCAYLEKKKISSYPNFAFAMLIKEKFQRLPVYRDWHESHKINFPTQRLPDRPTRKNVVAYTLGLYNEELGKDA